MKTLTALAAGVLLLFLLIVSPMYLPEKANVVIIGAGAAGMRAALESINYTDKIVLLEKMPYPGGNSLRATAGMNAALVKEEELPYFLDTKAAGQNHGIEHLIALMIGNSGEALRWLRKRGADLSDRGLLAGHSQMRTYRPSGGSPVGQEISSTLYREVIKKGIDLRLENKALKILQGKKKLEVLVENRTGREYRIRARSVIISTGGFGGNPVIVTQLNPELKGFNTTNSAGATGDYLSLTEDLPLQLRDMGEIQTHPTVEPDFSILITEALRGNGGILVNKQGERFTDEMDFREILSHSILNQKDGIAWLIFDQSIREGLRSVEYYIDKELVKTGATLADLAEILTLPEQKLSQTVENWNQSVKRGYDREYNRKDLSNPLEKGPYYAIKVTPGVHYCMGGLAINEKAQILDLDDQPFPGLYAAGEATGGIHGKDRLGGNSLIDAMVFGRIAGYEASLYALNR